MNDVFISYSHIDDQSIVEGKKGWISGMHRVLGVRLSQLLGYEARIWRDQKLQGIDVFDEEITRQFIESKVLSSSQLKVKSPWSFLPLRWKPETSSLGYFLRQIS